jgi:hypothetical protein
VCYHPPMRPCLVAVLLAALTASAQAADPLTEARRLYNLGQYEMAERLAREATTIPARADAARVVLGRIQLERFRQSSDPRDLSTARASLRMVEAAALDAAERVELTIGFAEALYLDNRYGAAAQLFESVRQRSSLLGRPAHERVLDWWATAVDRQAQTHPPDERPALYRRILDRMDEEVAENPGSTAAGYWLAAAARASGDLERAWHAAQAGWLRAALAEDHGAALRADLDRLVLQAIIPERAAKVAGRGDPKEPQAAMREEWESFKRSWTKQQATTSLPSSSHPRQYPLPAARSN